MGVEARGRARALAVFFLFLFLSALYHHQAFTRGVLLAPANDAINQNYPQKHLYSYALHSGQLPLWSPYEFAGLPFLAEIQRGTLYPLNLLIYLGIPSPAHAFNFSYILHFALAGFFTYLYLRLLGLSEIPSFAGGMIFGFTGFMASNNAHTAITNSAAYMPLLMYLLERLRRTPSLVHVISISLAVAVQLLAGNFQVCVYTWLIMSVFVVFHAASGERGTRLNFVLLWTAAMVLGFLVVFPQILATSQMSAQSWMEHSRVYRGYEYFSLYHVYLITLPAMVFPLLFNGWGPTDAVPFLVGVIPLAGAFVALSHGIKRDRTVSFWLLAGVLGFILALGSETPINRLLYSVPVYNMSRVQGRNLIEFTLALAVLGSVGIEWMLYGHMRGIPDNGRMRAYQLPFFFLSLLLTGSVIALLAVQFVSPATMTGYLASKGFANPHFFKSALAVSSPNVYPVLIMIFIVIVWVLVYRRFQTAWMRAIFVALVIVECFMVSNAGGISGPTLKQAGDLCTEEPYAGIVRNDPGLYRMANIFQLGSPIKSALLSPVTCRQSYINSYDPLCQTGISSLLELWRAGDYTNKWDLLLKNNAILSMLGVKYLKIAKDADVLNENTVAASAAPLIKNVPLGEIRLISSASRAGNVLTLKASGDGKGAVVSSGALELKRGFHAIAVSARVSGQAATDLLRAEMVPFGEQGGAEVLHVITDTITRQWTTFHAIFALPGDGIYVLDLLTPSVTPIEVRDIGIVRLEGYAPMPLAPAVKAGTQIYRKLSEQGDFNLYQNLNVLPRAWAVRELVAARDIYDVKRMLETYSMNPALQAALDPEDIRRIGRSAFSPGTVGVGAYSLNEVELNTEFPSDGFVVLADQYYEGWQAHVDGAAVPIYAVNGMLRGVEVPAGSHKVRFIYRPRALMAGILAGGLFFMTGLGYVAWVSLFRRRK